MSPVSATSPIATGTRLHLIRLQNPGTSVPDGDGGYTTPWVDCLPPQVFARIIPATAADLERSAAGTVVATATHLLRIPYHPQITTQTRVNFRGRLFSVTGIANPEERNRELILTCEELVP